MLKTTSTPKPAALIIHSAPPLIAANTTLEQEKVTVFACWFAMGGKEDVLRRKYREEGEENECTVQMRDELSDDVSEWCWVTVAEGRVKGLYWSDQEDDWEYRGLSGLIPVGVGALSAFLVFNLPSWYST